MATSHANLYVAKQRSLDIVFHDQSRTTHVSKQQPLCEPPSTIHHVMSTLRQKVYPPPPPRQYPCSRISGAKHAELLSKRPRQPPTKKRNALPPGQSSCVEHPSIPYLRHSRSWRSLHRGRSFAARAAPPSSSSPLPKYIYIQNGWHYHIPGIQ